MTWGPGKYDDLATFVRHRAGIKDGAEGGGVMVIVIGGEKGNGFSVQADAVTTLALPDLLEHVAKQIRGDIT